MSVTGARRSVAENDCVIATARSAGTPLDIGTDPASGISAIGVGGFVNRYDPPRRLLIVGAVQIAQSLTGLARELGIKCTVIDPRGRFLTPARFPDVTLDDRWPDEAVTALRPDRAIEGPAGLYPGVIGPAEIALSIAAAMVRSFHGRA
ncbi:MAG: XdhC family protein [Sphingomonas sp.]|nr:XdhC family protein [Sphingomonas sp.]